MPTGWELFQQSASPGIRQTPPEKVMGSVSQKSIKVYCYWKCTPHDPLDPAACAWIRDTFMPKIHSKGLKLSNQTFDPTLQWGNWVWEGWVGVSPKLKLIWGRGHLTKQICIENIWQQWWKWIQLQYERNMLPDEKQNNHYSWMQIKSAST